MYGKAANNRVYCRIGTGWFGSMEFVDGRDHIQRQRSTNKSCVYDGTHCWALIPAPYASAIGQPESGGLLQGRIRVLSIAQAFGYSSLVLGASAAALLATTASISGTRWRTISGEHSPTSCSPSRTGRRRGDFFGPFRDVFDYGSKMPWPGKIYANVHVVDQWSADQGQSTSSRANKRPSCSFQWRLPAVKTCRAISPSFSRAIAWTSRSHAPSASLISYVHRGFWKRAVTRSKRWS